MLLSATRGETLRGKEAIEGWIARTIEKYKFQFKPLSIKEEKSEMVVAIEISGTFPENPVTLDYHFNHFKLEKEEILALAIE